MFISFMDLKIYLCNEPINTNIPTIAASSHFFVMTKISFSLIKAFVAPINPQFIYPPPQNCSQCHPYYITRYPKLSSGEGSKEVLLIMPKNARRGK